MRSNKGITLTSVLIYIIGLVIVVGMLNSFSSYFFTNVDEIVAEDSAQEQYSRFLSYITKDINSEDLLVAKTGVEYDKRYITLKFKDGIEHQYIIQNGNLYYLDIKENVNKIINLCKNVNDEQDSFILIDEILNIYLNIDGQNFSTSLNVR